MTAPLLKTCNRCETPKLLSEFPKHRSSSDGRMKTCSQCRYNDVPLCTRCHERPPDPRYHICSRCRHGDPVPCPTCNGTKRPEATQCAECFRKRSKGANHNCWKGGRVIDGQGYVRIYAPEDDRANCGRYMKEHTLVMEAYLGRRLIKGETIHHINGDRGDNRLDNLELWSKSHPSGQRVEDKVKWAREILACYGNMYGNS
jgi:hypothetical protein